MCNQVARLREQRRLENNIVYGQLSTLVYPAIFLFDHLPYSIPNRLYHYPFLHQPYSIPVPMIHPNLHLPDSIPATDYYMLSLWFLALPSPGGLIRPDTTQSMIRCLRVNMHTRTRP
eukprot:6357224-Pyramimonas_sp.AAC.1